MAAYTIHYSTLIHLFSQLLSFELTIFNEYNLFKSLANNGSKTHLIQSKSILVQLNHPSSLCMSVIHFCLCKIFISLAQKNFQFDVINKIEEKLYNYGER